MNYLIEHAKENVWCNPRMDRQCNLELKRITREKGALKTVSIPWFEKSLPDSINYYHCFMVGHIPKYFLGIEDTIISDRWYNLCDIMSDNFLILNFFHSEGKEICRANSYFLFTNTRDVFISVLDSDNSVFEDDSKVYLRIYSNSFYSSNRYEYIDRGIECNGLSKYDGNSLEDFVNRHNNKLSYLQGEPLACINGYWYHRLDTRTIPEHSIIDSVFDGSIKDIHAFNISELEPFLSKRDKLRKYLIHLPKIFYDEIQYYDDNDYYVGYSDDFNDMIAIRIPTIDVRNIRQVTHTDYSISTDIVSLITRKYFDNIDSSKLKIWVVTRYSGYERSLWYVNDKIRALYKLPDEDIIDAMLNIDSTVDFWTSESLEDSDYVKLMGDYDDIDMDRIINCYGYRGLYKALSDSIIKTKYVNDMTIEIPYNFKQAASVVEYNSDRTLSGIYEIQNSDYYSLNNLYCPMIEFVKGDSTEFILSNYCESQFEIDPDYDYRFFITDIFDGVIKYDKWEDVTDSGKYTISNNIVKWNDNIGNKVTALLGTDKNYYFEKYVPFEKQCLIINLESLIIDAGGTIEAVDNYLHYNYYRIWLNNKALIREIDFKILNNVLYIYNKDYIDPYVSDQKIVVLADGIKKENWSAEKGYIIDGIISLNKQYDYYDDRLNRVIIDGKIYTIDELMRPENYHNNITVRNGSPYSIENLHPPIKYPGVDFDTFKTECLDKEEVIKNYLSLKIPENLEISFNTIDDYYHLYSIFFSRIINDLRYDELFIPEGRVDDVALDKLLKGYKYLLDIDLAKEDLDLKYIRIHPHPYSHTLSVTQKHYNILERIIDLYELNISDLTPFLEIEN